MGFKVEVVDSCPVTRGSQGVMTLKAEHIAMIAGAVRDKIEWMALLHGTRSDDGYEVVVERFTVPPQYRSAGEVELAQDITLPDDCVGVIHSHHSMGAFFSGTDRQDLNPRFPSSIVVAIATNNLGFKYQICGKVMLPCNAIGTVDFELTVAGAEKYFQREVVRGKHDKKDLLAKDTVNNNVAGLAGCTQRRYVDNPSNKYLAVLQSACGLSRGDVVEKPMVFGMDGADLLAAVEEQAVQRVNRALPAHYGGTSNNGNYNRKDGYMAWNHDTQQMEFVEFGKPYGETALDNQIQQGKRGRGRGKGKGKYSAKKNGLVKLERPEPRRDYTTVIGNCDDCGDRKVALVRVLNPFVDEYDWLCRACEVRLERAIAEVYEDSSVVVTDEIAV